MDARQLGHHISHKFDDELEALRSRVLEAGGLVESQLGAALDALMSRDAETAERVIVDDYKVNALEVSIDEESTRILARRQPLASDLRLVVSVIKTVTDLERMGDEAVRIARMAARLAVEGGDSRQRAELRHLGDHVRTMLRDALDAFARTDVALAGRVLEEDRRVDREYESITRELITYMMEDPRAIPRALEVMWAARALERIGDRACNICEYVIYFVKGRDVRHTSLDEVLSETRGGP
ncbi:MAG: phosphate signaling complex protein PhoU [Ectothiorhodospiraceae bacterium]|nr:phosphate signaling complex protein PhoU [Chromatiales bacterium]MCP5155345.1 phosphate signaling complex protein PhoU [Ectothiorhodospiraceae bacterium]